MKNKRTINKKERGITLIALVVTIIVLLILAGISISMVLGNNGLIQRTSQAREENIKASGREQIGLEVLGSYGTDGKLSYDEKVGYYDLLTENVGSIKGLTDKEDKVINIANPIKKLPATVKLNGFLYKISDDGRVEDKNHVNLPKGIKIGDLVTYEPIGNTFKWEAEYTSSDLTPIEDDVILNSQVEGEYRVTEWKVFKINDDTGEIQLVPSALPSGKVRMQGAQGYNNGVKLLNDACNELYKDNSRNITARSIKIEDIESVIKEEIIISAKENYSYPKNRFLKENNQISNSLDREKRYPLIYEYEKNSIINGKTNNGNLEISDYLPRLLKRDDRTTLNNDETTSNVATDGYLIPNESIQPFPNIYYMDERLSSSTIYNNYNYAYILNKNFWIASRTIAMNGNLCFRNYGC